MFENFLFITSAILTLSSSVAMLVTRNLIHSCVFLLGSLLGVAGLYVTLGADFIAATQIIVYVGGVVILMLFAVMLTGGHLDDGKEKSEFERIKIDSFGKVLAPLMGNKTTLSIGLLTSFVFVMSIIKVVGNRLEGFAPENVTKFQFSSTVEKIGTLLITDHVLAFEVSSILLLGALIGAAIIARPRKIGEEIIRKQQ